MITIRPINRGAFGEVDEIEEGGVRYARKTFSCMPHLANDPQLVAKQKLRFKREVSIQSKLGHPNILPIVSSNLCDEPPFFLMPLADKSFHDDLESRRANRGIDGDIEIAVWQDLLAGVEEIHRLGYVHRDLKPQNLLFSYGAWKVADFGLVMPMTPETTQLTSTHSAWGTKQYAAPEQSNDFKHVTEQADIFALGCMLHDAVEPVPIRVPFAQVNCVGTFADVIRKCTVANPQDRYRTVAEFRSALFDAYAQNIFDSETNSPGGTAAYFDAVREDSTSAEAWLALIIHIENLDGMDKHFAMKSVSGDLISALKAFDELLFSRLMASVCNWATSTGFDFDYCDVVGDRLMLAFQDSRTRIKMMVVHAAAELAVSHNRWRVMHQVGRMLEEAAPDDLADRFVIDAELNPDLVRNLLRIERVIGFQRSSWHPKIAGLLDSKSGSTPA
jgi:serine/threonine protein kinase